jgi:antimicrobial peptide system SdpA family protein
MNFFGFIYFKIIINILIILLILFLFAAANKKSILFDDYEKNNIMSFFPQGWSFFTRDPREDLYVLFRVDSSKITKVNLISSSNEYFWGLSRKNRIIAYEMSLIQKDFKEKDFSYIKRGDFSSVSKTKFIPNLNLQTISNGTYIIEIYPPIPWAWLNLNQEKYIESKCVKFILL